MVRQKIEKQYLCSDALSRTPIMHEDPQYMRHNLRQEHFELRTQSTHDLLNQVDDGVLHGTAHCPVLLQ